MEKKVERSPSLNWRLDQSRTALLTKLGLTQLDLPVDYRELQSNDWICDCEDGEYWRVRAFSK
jgi:hypothetical protein